MHGIMEKRIKINTNHAGHIVAASREVTKVLNDIEDWNRERPSWLPPVEVTGTTATHVRVIQL